ncbi:GspE/PulE family protein [uncultured Lamprocystis sp.]|uniref:GspE/PulE family protein n=1 Tax=uncultured Lamprocystis sp. TaxID=543132 RepID=UPI0025CB91E4|nr:GspE/PulE family protein [uncultured Lamprocystis sp.]
MAAEKQIESRPDHRLTVDEVLDDLVADGMVTRPVAQGLLFTVTPKDRAERHALELVADAKIHHANSPKRIITLEELTFWLAKRTGLEYLRIDPLKIDAPNVGDLVTASYAAWNRILPVSITAEQVVFATSEPYLTSWIEELGGIIKREIVRVMANPRDIERYRKEFFGVSNSVKGASNTEGNKRLFGLGNLEALVELGKSGQIDANDSHIVHIVDWLLQYAFDQRASDIHLEPRREVGNIRFRIDGVMHPVYQVPALVMTAVTSRIKILGRMDVAEKRRPQDGRIKTRSEDGRELEMRLSTMPTAFGEKLVMRIFNPDVLLRDFADLGFGEEDAKRWQAMVGRPHGIILVTGPTGSGKTTTLYSTLKTLATPLVNVCTVEEPIEMVEPAFNQMQVQHNIGLDFASGIRTLMRQDPDIIMVGEIRDRETAEMAVQASLTGHLVLSTLHTNDAPAAITRLLDIGVPHYLIKATVIGVVAQRLVRTLCPHCKHDAPADPDLWESLVNPWKLHAPDSLWHPKGCLECRNTGYYGRIGLYEILTLDAELRELIAADFNETPLRRLAYQKGLRPLRISGAFKAARGVTSMEEVFKVAPIRSD